MHGRIVCNAILTGCAHRHKITPRRCQRRVKPGGNGRCILHGGASTGPTTEAGMANTVAAMVEGRRRWLKDLKDRGEPMPFGRKPGGRNRSLEERDQAGRDAEAKRAVRRLQHESRISKRARKQAGRQRRDEAAVLARRHERFQARDPDWYDTDLLDVALEAVVERGATKRDIAQLKRAERTFIERLRDNRDPPVPEVVERAYAKLTRIETALGGEGKDAPLARLQDAYDDWRKRRAVDGAIAHLAAAPGKPEPMSAREIAELVKRAGQIAGSRFAGVPYEVDFQGNRIRPGPHSIAPWLRRS
jgi:hypothetical protein